MLNEEGEFEVLEFEKAMRKMVRKDIVSVVFGIYLSTSFAATVADSFLFQLLLTINLIWNKYLPVWFCLVQLLVFVQSKMTQAMRISNSVHLNSTFYVMKVP